MAELRYFLTPLEVEPDGNRHVPFWRTRVQRERPAATSIGIQPFGARDFAIASIYAETTDLDEFAKAGAIELPRSGRITLAKLNAIRTMLGLAYVPPVLSANTDGLQVIRALGVVAQLSQRIRGRFGSRMEDADRTRFDELGGIWAPLKEVTDARDRLDAAVALWADRPIYTGGIDLGFGLPLAGGAIPATDSFTGSNGTTLPSHDSRWVDTGGGTWDILSNQAEVPDDSTETGVAFNDPDTIDNHIGIVDIVASGNYTGGAGARHATGANTYYTFYGEVGGNCFLYDISGTSGTELFAGSSCALNDELGCSAVGSTIKGWKNGLEITSVTDSTWTTGFTGMAGWANISPRLDNFEAYNIPITVLATTTGTSSGQTHNPGTGVTPKAVIVFMYNSTDSTDRVSSVSYGGVAMTRVPTNGFAQDTAGEPCSIYCYTLLSSIPTGSQSVTYSATGTNRLTTISLASVWSVLEIKASGKQEGDAANPSITLDSGADQATRFLGVMSGSNSGGSAFTPSGYSIELSDQPLSAAFAQYAGHHIMAKTGSVAIGCTIASDDVAAIAIALGESAGGGGATGTVAATFPSLTASATGAQTITGTVAATFPNATAAATGAMQPSGTVAATFPSVTAAATGTQTITGTVAATFPSATAAAAGTQTITGTVAATFPSATASATGVMQPSGTVAATFPSLTAAAAGTLSVSGTVAATFPSATAAATGVMQPSGTIAATFPSLVAAATATHGTVTTGTVAATFPSVTAAATGTQTITGTVAASFASPTASATGVMQPSGTVAATFPSPTAAATGTQTITGTMAATFPSPTAAASGAAGTVFVGTIAATFPSVTAAATATQTITGTIAATAPSPTAALVGAMQPSGTIAATFPSLVAAASGSGGADINGWVEVLVTIMPALELGVTTQPALEIDTEFNG